MSVQQKSYLSALGVVLYDGDTPPAWLWQQGFSGAIVQVAPGHLRLSADGTGGFWHPDECEAQVAVYDNLLGGLQLYARHFWTLDVGSGRYDLDVQTTDANEALVSRSFAVTILRRN